MQYAKINTPSGTMMIALDPVNFGAPYQKLFDQTDAGGYDVWRLESHDNFRNPFAQSSKQRYNDMGWWSEIFRDKIVGSAGTDDKGRLKLTYVSHAGTEWEKAHDVWAPKEGWYVPTRDGMFHEGTLVPFETAESRKDTVKRWENSGLDTNYVSRFYRLNDYENDERFVGRAFSSRSDDCGRFYVFADWLPSDSGFDGVASRQKYEEPHLAMEIALSSKKS